MKSVKLLFAALGLALPLEASAKDHRRIKRPPPSAVEAARIASDLVMNDSLLRKGDIIVTDRGFLVFQGIAPDGVTSEFVSVPSRAPGGNAK